MAKLCELKDIFLGFLIIKFSLPFSDFVKKDNSTCSTMTLNFNFKNERNFYL